ncbi:MAG: hypothetical protein GC185_05680 [Alphaproteobacteria bacterium]|nr:hypothetical protein [Alphaproteobacteria bacterium]
MKKYLFILPLAAALCFTSAHARAEDSTAAKEMPARHHMKKPVDFATKKARRLKSIDAHIQKLKTARTCVKAAADDAALDACLPEKYRHHDKSRNMDGEHHEHHEHHMDKTDGGQE